MPKVLLNNFSGGISDSLQNIDPSFCDECDNLLVTPSNGLKTRAGSDYYNSTVKSNNTGHRTDHTFRYKDKQFYINEGKLYEEGVAAAIKVNSTLDTEIIVNGDFTGWIPSPAGFIGWRTIGTWSQHIVGGTDYYAEKTNADTGYIAQNVTLEENEYYLLTFKQYSGTLAVYDSGASAIISFANAEILEDGVYVSSITSVNFGLTSSYIVKATASSTADFKINIIGGAGDREQYFNFVSLKKIIGLEDYLIGIPSIHSAAEYDTVTTQEQNIILAYPYPFVTSGYMPYKFFIDSDDKRICRTAGSYNCDASEVRTSYIAGALTYTYSFVETYRYSIGVKSYIDYGIPITFNITSVATINTTNYVKLYLRNYIIPVDATISVYRTIASGGVPYYVGEFGYNGGLFDVLTDAQIISNEVMYTYGGVLENNRPPKSKYVCSAGAYTYYGHSADDDGVAAELIKYRVHQSVGIDLDSVPSSFYCDVDDEITGIESVVEKPVVFTKSKIYRIEGQFDELGSGYMQPMVIHDFAGCISHESIVKTKDALYWAGNDGFYVTNGYDVKKLNLKNPNLINDTYKALTSTANKKRYIYGCFDYTNNRVIWGCQLLTASTDNDGCIVYDVSKDCFTTMSGDSTSASTFSPTAIDYNQTYGLIRCNKEGYIFNHLDSYVADRVYNSTLTTWHYVPIEFQYKHIKFDMGDPNNNKYVTKITANMRNLSNINLQIASYNDGRTALTTGNTLQELRCVNYNVSSFHGVNIASDSYITGQDYIKTRRFNTNKLRCKHKVVDIQNFNGAIFWSDQGGYGTVTISTSTKKATITGTWPTNIEQMTLYIELTSGVYTGYVIDARDSAQVLSLATAPGGNPAGKRWEIRGIEKGQVLELNSLEFDVMPYGMAGTEYLQPKDDAGNA